MIRLYTHPFSIFPRRVSIALHEKGLEYQSVETDLLTKPASPSFLALNPFAQIPVLDVDGFVISESIAILEYLEDKYPSPSLLPKSVEARAVARKLMCWSGDYWPGAWKKWMAPRMPPGLGDAWTDETVLLGRDQIGSHLDVLELQLAEKEWLVDDFSMADICYAPFVLALKHVDLGREVSRRENISRWVTRLESRRSIVETTIQP